MAAGAYLWDHMGDAPVLLLPCMRPAPPPPFAALPPAMQARYTEELAYMRRIRGASILTTNHIRCETEVKALLGIPEEVDTYALMPIGWPLGKYGPLTRRPLTEVAFTDRWGTPWKGAPEPA
jgi:hypothetical protein